MAIALDISSGSLLFVHSVYDTIWPRVSASKIELIRMLSWEYK